MKLPICAILAMCLLLPLFGCSKNITADSKAVSLEAKDREIDSLKQEITRLNNELATLEKKLSDAETGKSAVDTQVKEYRDTLEVPIKFEIDDLEQRFYYTNLINGNKLDGSYDSSSGLRSFDTVRSYLRSFEMLTEKTRKYLSKEEREKVGNLDGDVQTLGLANVPLNVQGTIYDQDYVIRKLDLELAIKKYEGGEISLDELKEKCESYKKSKQQYEEFIAGAWYGD